MNTSRRLTRSSTDRIIAGVAGGVANYLDVDPTLVRLGFVLLVMSGVSPLVYLILWAILPSDRTTGQSFTQQVRENISEMEQRATQLANQVGGQVSQMMGNDQARQANQSSSQSTTAQQEQNQGPATGPTQRL